MNKDVTIFLYKLAVIIIFP